MAEGSSRAFIYAAYKMASVSNNIQLMVAKKKKQKKDAKKKWKKKLMYFSQQSATVHENMLMSFCIKME